MSMAGGNPSLIVDVLTNTSALGTGLSSAERMVDQSAQRMGQKVQGSFGQFGDKISMKLGAAIGAGLAIKVVDDALRKVAEGIRNSQGAAAIGDAIANSIVESIRGVPIAGALMDITSSLADKALGGPMEREAAIARAQESMRKQEELRRKAVDAMGELELQATADPEILARAERAREVYRLRAIAERAKAGNVQIVDGVEQELEPGVIARARELVAKGLDIYDQRVRTAADEKRKRDAERMAAEEESRIKAQEEAYDRFIKGNTQEAILALESQLQAATSAAAPTRAERLQQIMAGMGTGIQTADTALGAFSFAVGDPAKIGRDMLESANKQLATLERIESIQAEIRDLQKGSGFN